jgi:hypothetical protein
MKISTYLRSSLNGGFMTKRQFVVLVFRLFALFLLFHAITNFANLLRMTTLPGEETTGWLLAGFALFFWLLVISVLWRKSEWLMEKVFAIPSLSDNTLLVKPAIEDAPRSSSETPEVFEVQDYYETPVSLEGIQLIAFSVVGLWAVFDHIPSLLKDLNFLLSPLGDSKSALRWLYPEILVVGLGVWLFLRPWQFQDFIRKFWPKEAESAENPQVD